MKVSEVIKALEKAIAQEGDVDVKVECEFQGRRSCQKLADVYIGRYVLFVSQEAIDADPINQLPVNEMASD